ncbi:transporter, major facilitator domain protein [Streptococcus ictaluri 707-05]|uniref:Transporter, major facilitator domain protein n=1 Tax=Streptococcus ictaluri 707-05 TaxID=764299 RepID=G5K1S5_9STRE|nr:MFS transporter [Streptococcus ictaluri]EHI70157.1 transporter, major facilitator domain protein [Streptococcus ictaluri 707-05]
MIHHYEQEHPETFARFLKRQKVVFLIAFFGYVCAYLVRNNFKLMSNTIMITNGWDKSQIATLLSCLTVSYGLAKFYMGALGDRVSLRKLFATSLGASALICILIGFFPHLYVDTRDSAFSLWCGARSLGSSFSSYDC